MLYHRRVIAALFFVIFLYLLWCRPYRRDVFGNGEYIARDRTSILNGILIWVVFVRHIGGYFPEGTPFNAVDAACFPFWSSLGQLLVAGFFFYSGYGIAESIARKGMDYVKRIPTHRFGKVLLIFDIAIVVFWLVGMALGHTYEWERIVLSLTGWSSIGNSNWFICVTLALYLVTYASFRWCGRVKWIALWVGCLLLTRCLTLTRPCWWYDTLLCFPAGMSFSSLRGWVEPLLKKSRIPLPALGLALVLAGWAGLNYVTSYHWIANGWAILVAYGTVLLFSGVAFRKQPRLLLWMGGALFSLYIYQRIPMMVLAETTSLTESPALYIFLCAVLTVLIAMVSERLYGWLGKRLFSAR